MTPEEFMQGCRLIEVLTPIAMSDKAGIARQINAGTAIDGLILRCTDYWSRTTAIKQCDAVRALLSMLPTDDGYERCLLDAGHDGLHYWGQTPKEKQAEQQS